MAVDREEERGERRWLPRNRGERETVAPAVYIAEHRGGSRDAAAAALQMRSSGSRERQRQRIRPGQDRRTRRDVCLAQAPQGRRGRICASRLVDCWGPRHINNTSRRMQMWGPRLHAANGRSRIDSAAAHTSGIFALLAEAEEVRILLVQIVAPGFDSGGPFLFLL
jgi:hypothetical protein